MVCPPPHSLNELTFLEILDHPPSSARKSFAFYGRRPRLPLLFHLERTLMGLLYVLMKSAGHVPDVVFRFSTPREPFCLKEPELVGTQRQDRFPKAFFVKEKARVGIKGRATVRKNPQPCPFLISSFCFYALWGGFGLGFFPVTKPWRVR